MKTITPKYILAKKEIKELIKSGSIVDKLPGERILAKNLDLSYMTIRKAIAELVEEGLLYKNTTKGTFVSNNKTTSKTTKNIGFFLDATIKESISSPYYSLIFNALEKEVKKKGYNLILFSDFDDLNPFTSSKKIDGVIINCFPRIEAKIQKLKKFLPIVLLENIASDKSIPSVTVDNFNSSSEAAKYLISLGHKRIGFISGLQDSSVCKERHAGYVYSLENSDIKVEKKLTTKGDYSFESGEKAAKVLLSLPTPPTAIMCANDSMAIGAMKVIQQSGYIIPKDISIIGFDDIEVSSRVFPSLTTIAVPIEKIVAKAIEMLLSFIKGEDFSYQHTILPANLVIRDTCTSI